ncbi:hypothetical protein GUITHDRAFT_148675 [Guillardia theta CCMP2712]|uniref:Leucine carboxyl methyltransferase 1 n=1 Tax=Guillardia theta (strain CCMP2712) TaxID=905079 RepID=L1I7X8_GUITC|nr:hypothetical protein GUITHDRAFT_148675 [Guillardia theta CCMP2712]EKX32356.1 hypothetical protein GUITHDRAFT_148675 [Guillardia theta CCMP2712]|eukprot:XP_005819336.1 hypothetical protein GUITHDRAFT_148675 [Guillardia theta CCMP2712]
MTHEVERLESTSDTCSPAIALCKSIASSKGYYQDPFIHVFVSRSGSRPPLINRGHYARVTAVRNVIFQFLEACGNNSDDSSSESDLAHGQNLREQIVILGSGLDSTFFYLKNMSKIDESEEPETEVDDKEGDLGLRTREYTLLSCDMRNCQELEAALGSAGVDFSAPTLFISECVLIYMKPAEGTRIIEWAANLFPCSIFFTYEQIHPHDPFGKVMAQNISLRGCPLLSFEAYPDCDSQKQRYLEATWETCEAISMQDFYDGLPEEEKSRVAKIEWLDEIEEWKMIQQHYCFILATKDAEGRKLWANLKIST